MKSILFLVILFSGFNYAALASGKLPQCNNSPNCISSQSKIADKQHYIAPLEIKGDPEKAWAEFKQTINRQTRMVITHENDTSLHAEATSFIFRFIDDINAILDSNALLIHIRSASRMSHSEFGANRKRIEDLRISLQKAGVIE